MKNTKFRSRRFFFRASALAAVALPLAAALAPSAEAAGSAWAKGVTEESGWFDTNKVGNPWTGSDCMMCWAAASSNIIAWWQDQAPASAIPTGTPIGNDAIYAAFRNNFQNTAKGSEVAWKWYFGGCDLAPDNYASDFLSTVTEPEKSGRYWQNYVSENFVWPSDSKERPSWIFDENLEDVSANQTYAKRAASDIARMFSEGYGIVLAVGYGVSKPNYDASGHLVTLWGIEYDDDNVLTKIYITDSDDQRENRLIACTVNCEKEEIPDSYGNDNKLVPGWTKYTLTTSLDGETVALLRYGVLELPVPVPEPSAFALLAGLGALALAGTRRRRKKS